MTIFQLMSIFAGNESTAAAAAAAAASSAASAAGASSAAAAAGIFKHANCCLWYKFSLKISYIGTCNPLFVIL